MSMHSYIDIESVNFPPTLAELEILNRYLDARDKHRKHHLDRFLNLPADSNQKHLSMYCTGHYLSFEMYQWMYREIGGHYANT